MLFVSGFRAVLRALQRLSLCGGGYPCSEHIFGHARDFLYRGSMPWPRQICGGEHLLYPPSVLGSAIELQCLTFVELLSEPRLVIPHGDYRAGCVAYLARTMHIYRRTRARFCRLFCLQLRHVYRNRFRLWVLYHPGRDMRAGRSARGRSSYTVPRRPMPERGVHPDFGTVSSLAIYRDLLYHVYIYHVQGGLGKFRLIHFTGNVQHSVQWDFLN